MASSTYPYLKDRRWEAGGEKVAFLPFALVQSKAIFCLFTHSGPSCLSRFVTPGLKTGGALSACFVLSRSCSRVCAEPKPGRRVVPPPVSRRGRPSLPVSLCLSGAWQLHSNRMDPNLYDRRWERESYIFAVQPCYNLKAIFRLFTLADRHA